jgi:hypothetical protein
MLHLYVPQNYIHSLNIGFIAAALALIAATPLFD